MKDLKDLIKLWMEVFGVNNKVLSADLNVTPATISRLTSGIRYLSMDHLDKIGRTSGTSINTLLLAYMLMHAEEDDENRIPDIGDEIVAWLRSELEPHTRDTETDSLARHFLSSASATSVTKRKVRDFRLETKVACCSSRVVTA